MNHQNEALINLFEQWHGKAANDLLKELLAGKKMNRQQVVDILQVYIEMRDYIRLEVGDSQFADNMRYWGAESEPSS